MIVKLIVIAQAGLCRSHLRTFLQLFKDVLFYEDTHFFLFLMLNLNFLLYPLKASLKSILVVQFFVGFANFLIVVLDFQNIFKFGSRALFDRMTFILHFFDVVLVHDYFIDLLLLHFWTLFTFNLGIIR